MVVVITLINLCLLIIFYYIIRYKNTSYKYETIFVLKEGNINLIENVSNFESYDTVNILKIDKIVFNKVIETKYELELSSYYDGDDGEDDYY